MRFKTHCLIFLPFIICSFIGWVAYNIAAHVTRFDYLRFQNLQYDDESFGVQFKPTGGCIEADLRGCSLGAGIGNVVFEVISMMAIARTIGKGIAISGENARKRVDEVLPLFPALHEHFSEVISQSKCDNFPKKAVGHFMPCCRYQPKMIEALNQPNATMTTTLHFLQSYRYFSGFTNSTIRKFLSSTDEARKVAANDLFGTGSDKITSRNICVHIRRGDFQQSKMSLASDANFTKAAIEFLYEKDKTSYLNPPAIYIMTDDLDWAINAMNGTQLNIQYSGKPVNNTRIATAEWEFSTAYCDVVLMTASVSTFGWWMAYLSRGQEVYYNSRYSTKFGISRQLTEEDFFMPHWKALELNEFGKIDLK